MPPEFGERVSKRLKGKKKSEAHRQALSERPLHKKAIDEQCTELEKQGYRVIPLDGYVRKVPDIIAIKDNKVYAVEVQIGQPNYKKYHNISFYDDIIWVVVKGDRVRVSGLLSEHERG